MQRWLSAVSPTIMTKRFVSTAAAIAAIMMLGLCDAHAACSAAPEPPTGQIEAKGSSYTGIDVEFAKRIADKKSGSELTEKEYDYMLDQLQIVVRETRGMTRKQITEYLNSLNEEEGMAMLIVAVGAETASSAKKFTPAQRERYKDITEDWIKKK